MCHFLSGDTYKNIILLLYGAPWTVPNALITREITARTAVKMMGANFWRSLAKQAVLYIVIFEGRPHNNISDCAVGGQTSVSARTVCPNPAECLYSEEQKTDEDGHN